LASGHRYEYVARVIAADECPSVRWMVTTSQPARIGAER
jgi:hypothetical protein